VHLSQATDRSQAQVYRLAKEVSLAGGTPPGVVEVEAAIDELAKLRAARARAYG
jgi:hypothetical protein